MLLFAHTGIVLGAATVISGAISSRKEKLPWFVALGRYLDVRLLMVGAMLPDIIDKPVGDFLFRKTFENGRIFSHTLLFLVLLTASGLILYRAKRKVWMLTLAAGDFMHLALDQMWGVPQTLFWPLKGWQFPFEVLEGFGWSIWDALISYPTVYIPEIIGLAILLWYGVTALKRKQFGAVLKTGGIS
jgi:inner membrane protein